MKDIKMEKTPDNIGALDTREYIEEIERLDRLLTKAALIIDNQTNEIVNLDRTVKVQLKTIINLSTENGELNKIVEGVG